MRPKRRLQYPIALILIITATVAVVLGISKYYSRQRSLVINTYNAQKLVVRRTIDTFMRQLQAEGFHVDDHCYEQGGSGEWRHYVALTATKDETNSQRCYVEVMGFVSQDVNSQPTWAANLPMTISRRGRGMDERFVDLLATELAARGWQCQVDDDLRGVHNFRAPSRAEYIAAD